MGRFEFERNVDQKSRKRACPKIDVGTVRHLDKRDL